MHSLSWWYTLQTGGAPPQAWLVSLFCVLLIVFVFDRDTDMVVSITNFQLHIFVLLGILTGLIMVISELVKNLNYIFYLYYSI